MQHLLGLKELSKPELVELLAKAQYYTNHPQQQAHVLQQRFVANMFFENSTRTRFSFEVAQKRMGAEVLNFQESTSSTKKGESLYDTLKTLEAIGVEGVVIRHSQNGILREVKDDVQLSLINAGTGVEEHPTQGLLDMLTIQQEFGSFAGLQVAIIGDVEHSRVARSNYYALTKLGATVLFSGPESYYPQEVELSGASQWLPVDEAVRQADVVMLLRIQMERHDGDVQISKADYHQQYGLTLEREKAMQPHAIIMHPAPVNRGVEIDSSLVESPRSRIFKQMHNGVGVRMAVLDTVMRYQSKRTKQRAHERQVKKGDSTNGTNTNGPSNSNRVYS